MLKLTIRNLFILSAIGFLVSVSFLGGVNWYMSSTLKASQKDELRLMQAMELFRELRFSVVQIQQFLTDVSVTHDPAGFDEAQEHKAIAIKDGEKIVDLAPEYTDQIKRLTAGIEQLYSIGEEMAWTYINTGRDEGNVLMKRPDTGFDARSATVAEELDHLAEELKQRLLASQEQLAAEVHASGRMGLGFVGLLLVLGIVSYFFTYQKILPPLETLKGSLSELSSGDGDLTKRLPNRSHDEVGHIVEQFNSFLEMLHELIKKVALTSMPLSNAAHELAKVSNLARKGAHEQEAETHKVATAVTEMSAAINEVAQNATATMEETNTSNEKARTGKNVVHNAIDSINELASEVDKSKSVIERLENYSNDIDTILVTIKGIAEQTNLLALNAAIEAARAGEQGRGFAVVADEVRTLASRTHESTTEIQQMVEHLQSTAREAVDVMNRSHEKAQESVDRAAQAGDALSDITRSVSTIAEMSTQIATSSEEQSAVAEEINMNIVTINEITSKSVKLADDTAESASSLVELADELSAVVKKFKV